MTLYFRVGSPADQSPVRERPLSTAKRALSTDSVEKLSAWLVILAIASNLLRSDLLGVPLSAQMMVFIG
jgi:hypothetical protein